MENNQNKIFREYEGEVFHQFEESLYSAEDLLTGINQAFDYFLKILNNKGGVIRIQDVNDHRPLFITSRYPDKNWEESYLKKSSEIWETAAARDIKELILLDFGDQFRIQILPLLSDFGIQGLIIFSEQEFETQDIEIIESIKWGFGKYIANERNLANQLFYQDKFEKIGQAFARLNSNFSLDQIQLELLNGIKVLLNCEAAAIGLIDQNNEDLIVVKTLLDEKDWSYQIGIRKGEGLLGNCLGNEDTLIVNDVKNHKQFRNGFDAAPELDVQSLMCVALKENGNSLGLLIFYNKEHGGFTTSDKNLINTFVITLVKPILFLRTIQQLQVINAHLEASRWELIRSRNTLRSLIDNLPDSLYIIDRMYRIVAINTSRASRVKSEPRYLVGKICFEVLYNRSEPCQNCHVPETFFKKKITNRTEREWLENSEAIEWDVNTYPIYDESGAVIQVILVEKDVTEKKRMEAFIAQSEKMAAVGQLAAGIAHEINNPLTVIMANAQILQRELPDQEDWRELADLMQRAGERALHSVRNLLNFARKEQLDFSPSSVNETIDQALEMLRHEILERSVTLSFEPDDTVPLISASPSNLQSVWLNLIINAIDSFEGVPGKIRIKSLNKGKEIRVTITDNGKGIPESGLNRIFEPFFTTKDPGRGTGLGLSICHRIVKQHGGTINVDSKVGEGTTFTIILPTY